MIAVFSKLQRQYEVLTQLSEVHNVVLIAEYVPEPRQITDEWIRKHDWILAKALLDDSFRETLTEISNETVQNTMKGKHLLRILLVVLTLLSFGISFSYAQEDEYESLLTLVTDTSDGYSTAVQLDEIDRFTKIYNCLKVIA